MVAPKKAFAPQPQSRLLHLAGELRNRIYRLAIVKDDSIPVQVKEVSVYITFCIKSLSVHEALLLVCKQIHYEASEMYWLENHFTLTEDVLRPQPLAILATAFWPYMDKISKLSISHDLELHGAHPVIKRKLAFEVTLDIIKTGGAITLDGTRPLIEESTNMFDDGATICTCTISRLALYNDATDVVEWASEYADMLAYRNEVAAITAPELWCWTCAGLNAW